MEASRDQERQGGAPVAGRPGLRALHADELATRLAYVATLGPPDGTLVAAARAGRLPDPAERVRHLDRVAAAARGRHARTVFVLEWLGANDDKLGLKAPQYLRTLAKEKAAHDLVGAMRRSAEAAIALVLEGDARPTVGRVRKSSAMRAAPETPVTEHPSTTRASV